MMKDLSYIEISKNNLINNVLQFKKLLSKNKNTKNTAFVAVVKANAYGHGVREVVSILEKQADYFQVDDLLELREIRQYTKKPVLVFGFVSIPQLQELVELNGTLGIYDLNIAKELQKILKKNKKRIDVHVKIDALLGRQGILLDEAKVFFEQIKKLDLLDVRAVYSHFSNIEDVDNLIHAKLQYENLLKAKEIAKKVGFKNISHHISATSGFMSDIKNNWGGSMLRLGIGMYGLWPSEFLKKRFDKKIKLKPILRWVTHIAQVKVVPANYPIGYGCSFVTNRKTKIAVIPQGYSDGFDRKFSNNGEVLIGGKKCRIIGRVAMNMFVVDVSGLLKVEMGDEVVLLGRQGRANISADEAALRIDTINYELVTRIWPKLNRIIK